MLVEHTIGNWSRLFFVGNYRLILTFLLILTQVTQIS